MMNLKYRMQNNIWYNSYNIAVPSPTATVYVNIIEDETGEPVRLIINAGKAGSEVAGEVHVLSETASAILESGGGLSKLLEIYSGVRTSKVHRNLNGVTCSSIPEAIFIALLRYQQIKNNNVSKRSAPRINKRAS